jgi:ABC-type branched-chain amino acid transport system, permease component
VFWIFPNHTLLLTQIAIAGIFALSLDLLQGYGGMPSLGHAAYFGLGAYCAGLFAVAGFDDPLLTLLAAAMAGAVAGLLTGLLLARLHGIAFLMLTLSIGLILREIALRWHDLTGGEDGLYGAFFGPVLGLFELDLFGITAFWYVLAIAVLLILFTRRVLASPFGVRLEAVRENPGRAEALGISVFRTRLVVITMAATMAAMAGALLAQTTSFVSLETLSLERSVGALVMVAIGGLRSVYGAFIGAALYLVARDQLSALDPVFWYFWLGLAIIVVATFFSEGIIGLARRSVSREGR